MASVLEIVRGISQALSNTHDGALDENGDPIKMGLKRDEGCPILDKRVIDGFRVSLQGDILKINYCCETMLRDVHRGDFEGETDNTVENIVSFLKKEYKKVTKERKSAKPEVKEESKEAEETAEPVTEESDESKE